MLFCWQYRNYGGMMDSYNSMKTKLEQTGIYCVNEGSNISAELKAYAEGINILFNSLDKIENEYFIESAEDYGLARREEIISRVRDDLPLEQRREILMIYERSLTMGCTQKDFEELMKSYGVQNSYFIEKFSTYNLTVRINDVLSEGQKAYVEKRINLDFPSHLNVRIVYGE